MTQRDDSLAGIRVLDFSRLVPGPYCTLLLASMGAEVIKIEDPGGDPLRHFPPFVDGVGVAFRFLNAGKRSVVANLKQPRGRAAVGELAERCHVVVEGFRPGVAERLGIDFATLARRNQRLVYCSISGFGQEGPLRTAAGHDLTYAAMSGLLSTLSPDLPRVPGVQLLDSGVALLAVIRILAALRIANRGPQHLDISLAATAPFLMPLQMAEATATDAEGPSLVHALHGSPRYDVYRCADGTWIALAPLEESFWQKFRGVLEEEGSLAPDEEPASAQLHDIIGRQSANAWLQRFAAADVPCAPIRSVEEALTAGDVEAMPLRGDAPKLGEHTEAVLRTRQQGKARE